MILGIHCSIREGYLSALSEAVRLECRAMQMFAYRRHHVPVPEELAEFRRARKASCVSRLIVHVRYVPFLASVDSGRSLHSSKLLAKEMRLAQELGSDGLVLHAGAYSAGSDAARGRLQFAEAVERAFSLSGSTVPLLIENVPGGGRRMGGSVEELAALGEGLRHRNVPVFFCLDTAHAWAYGYDIASIEGMWRFLGSAHRLLGGENIRAFHLNDTRALLGSHREHHWHWGQGYLKIEGLRHLLERREFQEAIGILETPKGKGEDRANLAAVRTFTI